MTHVAAPDCAPWPHSILRLFCSFYLLQNLQLSRSASSIPLLSHDTPQPATGDYLPLQPPLLGYRTVGGPKVLHYARTPRRRMIRVCEFISLRHCDPYASPSCVHEACAFCMYVSSHRTSPVASPTSLRSFPGSSV